MAEIKHNKLSYSDDEKEVYGNICDGEIYWDYLLEIYSCNKCCWNTDHKLNGVVK